MQLIKIYKPKQFIPLELELPFGRHPSGRPTPFCFAIAFAVVVVGCPVPFAVAARLPQSLIVFVKCQCYDLSSRARNFPRSNPATSNGGESPKNFRKIWSNDQLQPSTWQLPNSGIPRERTNPSSSFSPLKPYGNVNLWILF